MSVVHGRKHTVEMTSEPIEVTSLSNADPKWQFVDPAGHVHVWIEVERGRFVVPTVESVEVGYYEDGEPMYELKCCDCEARIWPGTYADTNRVFIPGRPSYSLDGQSVSKVEAMYTAKTDELLPPRAKQQATRPAGDSQK